MGGWLDYWRIKLISTQVLVEVGVGVKLGNKESESMLSRSDCSTYDETDGVGRQVVR